MATLPLTYAFVRTTPDVWVGRLFAKTNRPAAITAKPVIETGPTSIDDLPGPGSGGQPSGGRDGDRGGKGSKSSPLLLILCVVLVLLLLISGAGGWYLMHHRGGPPAEPDAAAKKASSEAAQAALEASQTTVALEPFVANLADEGGHSYLRVALTLRVQLPAAAGDQKKAGEKPKAEGKGEGKDADPEMTALKAASRDVILGVLNRQTSEQLLAPDGKEQLKAALKMAFAAQKPPIAVNEIYFTDFLVQQ